MTVNQEEKKLCEFLKDLYIATKDVPRIISFNETAKGYEIAHNQYLRKIMLSKGIIRTKRVQQRWEYKWISTTEPNIEMCRALRIELEKAYKSWLDAYTSKPAELVHCTTMDLISSTDKPKIAVQDIEISINNLQNLCTQIGPVIGVFKHHGETCITKGKIAKIFFPTSANCIPHYIINDNPCYKIIYDTNGDFAEVIKANNTDV